MKKLIIISVLGVIVAGSTSTVLGQGYINFGGSSRAVWNNTGESSIYGTVNGPVTDSGFDATFLWSATSTTSPMPFTSIATNNTTYAPPEAAWAAIEGAGSSGWQLGLDAGTGTNAIAISVNNVGSFSYDAGAAFALQGSAGAGQVINLFAIAWENDGGLFSTLQAAEAADVLIGWSPVFSYTLGSGPPATPPAETIIPHFGVGPVPEPATLALAGLGGLSMLVLRRKKA